MCQKGLGCWHDPGCPGASFNLHGQLEASEKQSPYFQGQAALLFVLLKHEQSQSCQ